VDEVPAPSSVEDERIEVVALVVAQAKGNAWLAEHRELPMKPEVPLHHHRDAVDVILMVDAEADPHGVVDGLDEAVVDELDRAAKAETDVVVAIERCERSQQQVRLGFEHVVDVAPGSLDLTQGGSSEQQRANTDGARD